MALSRSAKTIGRGAAAVAAVVSLTVTGVGWSMVRSLESSIAEDSSLSFHGDGEDGAVDILLVGSDTRTDAQGNPLSEEDLQLLRTGDEATDNTDTILLVRIPNDGSSATVLSIPRDTYINNPDLGPTKINGVYGQSKNQVLVDGGIGDDPEEMTVNDAGEEIIDDSKADDDLRHEAISAGRQTLVDSVEGLTGVQVDHYAEIGLLGFVLLTDAVGGVEVCLNEPVDEPLSGAKFPAGPQTISGSDALSFVRQRHDLPAGDLDRIVRQQVYMSQLASRILSTGTLTDPGKLQALNSAVSRSLVIDQNWDVIDFAVQLQNISGDDVSFETIPVTAIDATGAYGESVVTVDTDEVHRFVAGFGGVDAAAAASEEAKAAGLDVDPGQVTVDVVNATWMDGLADDVQQALTGEGYAPGELLSEPESATTSQVFAESATSAEAEQVSKALGGLPIQSDFSLPPGTVRVVIADDYTGPRASMGDGGEQAGAEGGAAESENNQDWVQASGSELPPEIAERPKFDATQNVPCVN